MNDFVPRITGFLCNWCSYAGADLAGVSRFSYPPNLRVIRTMCSARVEPDFVFDALLAGSDGVLVLGCHFGDCHYATGNYYTDRRMALVRFLLDRLGIARARFDWDWVSAAEGARFASLVTEFTNQLSLAGPPGEAEGCSREEFLDRIDLGLRVIQSEPIRWLLGRVYQLEQEGNVFGEGATRDQLEAKLHDLVEEQLHRQSLLRALERGEGTVPELAAQIGLKSKATLQLITELIEEGLVTQSGEKDDYAVFASR